MTKTPCTLLATILLGTVLAAVAGADDRDPRGLAQAIADKLAAKRRAAAIHATDFQGTDLGCIILPRRELRPFGYAGHGFFCEADVSGEILGATLNRSGRQLCEIRGFYVGDFCYDIDICGFLESVCVV